MYAEDFNAMTNPYAPPRAAVRDIADPAEMNVPADRGTRFGAAMLDGIIFAAMVYLPMMIGAIIVPGQSDPESAGTSIVMATFGLAGIGLVVWSWLTIKYVRRNGQSIAKKLLGIRVVRTDGTPVSLGRLFWLRNALNGLISIVPFYGVVDVLFIFGESRQCLHDKLADTIVVKA